MARYSSERKDAVLKKMLPPQNMTISQVSEQEGISTQTLYNWRYTAKQQGMPVPGKTSTTDDWSSEAKLAVIIETATLSESALSQYCREKGLYPQQVARWKQECLQGFEHSKAASHSASKQAKADKTAIKQLKKDLHRKEKALAEAAALLVLRKKLNAFWEDDEEHSP